LHTKARINLKMKKQFSDDSANLSKYGPAPGPKKNRSTTSSVYCNMCKSVGKPENENQRLSGKDLEQKLRDDFKDRDRTILVAVVTALWERVSMMTIEWTKLILEINIALHRSTMMTAPEANTIAIALLPPTCISSLMANRLLSASLKIGTSFRRVLSRTMRHYQHLPRSSPFFIFLSFHQTILL
jgi:hypothetical protein